MTEFGAAATFAPALILLDLHMPEMNGLEVLATYREQPRPHTPVVLCTASRDAAALADQFGAAGVLPKPFDLGALERLLGHHGSER